MKKLLLLLTLALPMVSFGRTNVDISLDGEWDCGFDRKYDRCVQVPGLAVDPKLMTESSLWYRKSVSFPSGDWNKCDLELKGARFRPKVYLDGVLVSGKEGGMSRTVHPLPVIPGKTVLIEIELAPLSKVPVEDASRIPEVDQWRSNVSSCLWDDVELHLYKDARVDRVLTFCNSADKHAEFRYRVQGSGAATAVISISDADREVVSLTGTAESGENSVSVKYAGLLDEWSPSSPKCYEMTVMLKNQSGDVLSEYSQTLNLREFSISEKQFVLNGKRITARGGSVVWHRWMRDSEAAEVGFDSDWFEKKVIAPMKERGANYLRFHLGVPPERLLDACDRNGMMVQYEWSFFHGMPASLPSLLEQYSAWLDVASRHPSVVIFHPYNETEPDELVRVNAAIDSLQKIYPPMVMEDRQVTNLHRYWWGMSENLGLYFDSYKQFKLPVMVDEFGGIYLDGDFELGGYPMLKSGMKRWQGGNHTAADRIRQQNLAYGKVGEYWRRTGVAGVAAFPVICSWNDGNHWYVGPIKDAKLKEVWDKMTVVWSERTVTMDVWNRNFTPGRRVRIPVHFINDGDSASVMKAEISVGGFRKTVRCRVAAHSRKVRKVRVMLPLECGPATIKTALLNPPSSVKHPVESEWEVNVLEVRVPSKVASAPIYIPKEETELCKMAKRCGLKLSSSIEGADLIALGRRSWESIQQWCPSLDEAVRKGASVVMLDVGDNNLGKCYDDTQTDLGNLSGAPKISNAEIVTTKLFAGLSVTSVQVAEGESHIHPSQLDSCLWNGLDAECTRLWNGLRGGVIVPAANLEVSGISQEAFISMWTARGADKDAIVSGPYFSYEYCGFYAYDDCKDSAAAEKYLRDKVAFLVEDMPAMALSLPRNTPIRVTDLHGIYIANEGVRVSSLSPLAVAGKDLVRTPVMKIRFGEGEGALVLSQLITRGRLAPGYAPKRKVRPLEYDPAAVSLVLNMYESALDD